MSKPKIITRHTYKPGAGREDITEPSMTVPGEARTIGDIVKRYQTSGEIPKEGDAQYFDVEDINQINKYHQPGQLDLTDLDQLREKNRREQEIIKKAVEAKKEAEKQAKKEAEEEAKKEELRKEIETEKEDN